MRKLHVFIACSLACFVLSTLFACTQPYIERNLTDGEKLQMRDLNQRQMMAPPQEQAVIECRKKHVSREKDDKPNHSEDFLYDVIVPEEEVCEEIDPADAKSTIQMDGKRMIEIMIMIDRQLKEALEKVNKKE